MRTNVDHLPQVQQDELARVMRILMAEFEEATGRATQPWRRNGKIYKIILFGSYARDDWVSAACQARSARITACRSPARTASTTSRGSRSGG